MRAYNVGIMYLLVPLSLLCDESKETLLHTYVRVTVLSFARQYDIINTSSFPIFFSNNKMAIAIFETLSGKSGIQTADIRNPDNRF